jgi:antitoxin component YwqK of YwqJK toxin-antitoxin module
MRLRFIICFILIALSGTVFSQTSGEINQTDENGMKQGYWIMKNKNITVYEGYFKDGHPVGEFKRYNTDNSLRSLLVYSEDGKEADATFYHPNGLIASKGKYVNQLKEGVWKFFSMNAEGNLIAEEEYSKNLRNGLSIMYYPDQIVAERLIYTNGIKHGEWTQYYPNGALLLKTRYSGGMLNGNFEVWFENGKIKLTGEYRNNLKEGHWLVYNNDGTLKYEMNYVAGTTSDRQMEIDESEFIDSLERNKEKIMDPEKTGILW